MKLLVAFALALSLSCGGTQAASSSEPCDDVAAHLVKLAMQDNGSVERPPEMDGVERELQQQCQSSPWSAERRTCLLAANDQEQTLSCPLD